MDDFCRCCDDLCFCLHLLCSSDGQTAQSNDSLVVCIGECLLSNDSRDCAVCSCAGEWLDGQAHGLGSYRFASGDFYEGEFEDNTFHGFGAFQKQCGLRILGRWISGKLEGWSLVISPNGKRFAATSKAGTDFSARESQGFSGKELSKIFIQVDEIVKNARCKISVIRQEQHRET